MGIQNKELIGSFSWGVIWCALLLLWFSTLIILVNTAKTCWQRIILIRHFVLVLKTRPLGSVKVQLSWISRAFNIVTNCSLSPSVSLPLSVWHLFYSSHHFLSIICIPEILQFTVGLLEGEFALNIGVKHSILNLLLQQPNRYYLLGSHYSFRPSKLLFVQSAVWSIWSSFEHRPLQRTVRIQSILGQWQLLFIPSLAS